MSSVVDNCSQGLRGLRNPGTADVAGDVVFCGGWAGQIERISTPKLRATG